jgi:hypothetical protein
MQGGHACDVIILGILLPMTDWSLPRLIGIKVMTKVLITWSFNPSRFIIYWQQVPLMTH